MRRSTVLFPLPDGPTSARSSPSAISIVRSRTAAKPLGKIRLTFFKMIDATSTLYRPTGQTSDDAALRNQYQDRYWSGRDHCSGQNLSPRHQILTAKQRDSDGDRVPLGTERERERKEKLVPAIEKRQDRRRRQSRCRQWQDNLAHRSKTARPVDQRRLFQVQRQLPEESGQEPDCQWHRKGQIREHQPLVGVQQVQFAQQEKQRRDDRNMR